MIIRSRIGQTAKVLTPKKVLINTCTIIPIFEHLLCANLKISTTTAGSRVAAVLVAQSCPTLCDPMNWPTRLLHPWDSPSKNTGVDCHSLLQKIEPRSPALQADSLDLSNSSTTTGVVAKRWQYQDASQKN